MRSLADLDMDRVPDPLRLHDRNRPAERFPEELRGDLQTMRDRLGAFPGLSTEESVRPLIERGPADAVLPGTPPTG